MPPQHSGPPKHLLPHLFLLTLPVVFLLVSFVLSIVSTASKDWSHQLQYDPSDDSNTHVIGTVHRSPFVHCTLEPIYNSSAVNSTSNTNGTVSSDNSTDVSGDGSSSDSDDGTDPALEDIKYREHCERRNDVGSTCDNNATTTRGDGQHFCQQLNISAACLIAGCVLIGLAFVISLILFIMTAGSVFAGAAGSGGRRHEKRVGRYKLKGTQVALSYTSLFTLFLCVLGFLCLLFGSLVGANNLINLQFPQGNWYVSGTAALTDHVGPWLMGNAVGLGMGAWVLALCAVVVLPLVWELPKVGAIMGGQWEKGVQREIEREDAPLPGFTEMRQDDVRHTGMGSKERVEETRTGVGELTN